MADNLALPPSGATAATDKVTYSGDANVDVQLVRVVQITGAEGSKTVVESLPASLGQKTKAASVAVVLASDSDDLVISGAVTASGTVGLSAGTANIGDVDVLTIAAGDNNIGNVDVVTLPALVASSANIGDVDVLTVPAPLSTTGAGTQATALRTTSASDDPAVVALQILDNIVSGSEAQVDIVAALPAGTNAIGKLAANSGVDIGDVDILSTVLPVINSTSAVTSVNDTATSTTLLSSAATRKGFRLYNNSTVGCYVKYGTTASATDFSVYIPPQGYLAESDYYGRVDAIWVSDASGAMLITSLSA